VPPTELPAGRRNRLEIVVAHPEGARDLRPCWIVRAGDVRVPQALAPHEGVEAIINASDFIEKTAGAQLLFI
jgi:hypothetical protein